MPRSRIASRRIARHLRALIRLLAWIWAEVIIPLLLRD